MIRLENISKYYHNEGIVTQGLHKINLELHIGEFIAITGESGSGKSTLLNVISGVDTYEDGEYYINGEETSYYDESDWERFRRDSVGFIFQNYNLIDSYSVLKNVEIAMLIQGIDRKTRRKKALDIIEKVGLTSHLRHRASKLSGGQKQRLAIARALAKDTPIIVADEPTGNLDSESGKQILNLLNEVSKDRLVIVVTHNYEAVEPYVTRKIRLFDGEIVEDKIVRDSKKLEVASKRLYDMNDFTKVASVSLFNLIGQPRRSILVLLVAIVSIAYLLLQQGVILSQRNTPTGNYYNNYNIYPERIIVTKINQDIFTNSDYEDFKKNPLVDSIVIEDEALDLNVYLERLSNNIYLGQGYFSVMKIDKVDIGRMPIAKNEILISCPIYSGDRDLYEEKLNQTMIFSLGSNFKMDSTMNMEFKIVGFQNSNSQVKYHITPEMLEEINLNIKASPVPFYITNDGSTYSQNLDYVMIDETLETNHVIIPEIHYGDDALAKYWIGLEQIIPTYDDKLENTIKISRAFANQFYLMKEKQLTVNMKDANDVEKFINQIYEEGYYAYSPYKGLRTSDQFRVIENAILDVVTIIGMFINSLFAFLISYLILRSTMNSKIKDYSILRTLGIEQKNIKNIIRFEIIVSYLGSYLLVLLISFILSLNIPEIETFFGNFSIWNYLLIALLSLFLAFMISWRVIVKMQKKSLLNNTKGV